MSDLLIRNIDEETKRALAVRAAEHGRSQQSEALSIIRESLCDDSGSWVTLMRENALSVGGMDFEIPKRHAPRFTATGM